MTASGVAVTTMVSDVPFVPRAAFVGVDNRAAGRLAGYILRRFLGAERPAQVAMFAGSLSYRAHEEREMGFRRLLAEEAPHLRIVELREMRDDPARAYREACALLDAYPELAGIYNIGGGNAGIARALKERGRARRCSSPTRSPPTPDRCCSTGRWTRRSTRTRALRRAPRSTPWNWRRAALRRPRSRFAAR